ncbi:DUF4169 family protein [Pseudotabrizicola alkalilacus]|uniref:DUF4169 family protein n=1 Tax=Pseudotabrizicola alkalilacus TaxID=2305252 RepID=A0A411YXU5_9RHOB|nr:DUF4169 family protein [Pseudotabrizicola alkalilacus]RGP35681.1 DUF4169 family protein [Pseudotabrizicola alkalilacus]
MAEVVNLRMVKKHAARKAARAQADENAVKFGLTRTERDRQKAEADKAARDLAAHKREP